MNALVQNCACFGVFLCLGAYFLAVRINRRWKSPLTNPLLLAAACVIAVLVLCRVDYTVFRDSAGPLSYLLTPATVSLAIPLYRQLEQLRRHARAIVLGVLSGVLTSGLSILAMSALFGLSHAQYVTLLPKSVTTAIGMSLSSELGGAAAITVTAIVVTGILGNCMAVFLCRLFRITEPVARGIAIGTASHALGTSKAIELGEVEGAMSGLSIAMAGLMTVVAAQVFAMLW
ncbi:MAG: LrgB family protein [Clostridiaceae bacterium]|nr:LrgB family protein [Clostridiaceae bacterium]